MNFVRPFNYGMLFQIASWCVIAFSPTHAQDPTEVVAEPVETAAEGPAASLEFEKSFRAPDNGGYWNAIPFEQCKNITELNKDLWSKKQVLMDFKQHRTEDQVGVIVFVKTEYCCDDSRLCAVATACMEKKSTPLIGRFRVYAGWIHNHPEHPWEEWSDWDADLIDEYDFRQGPGARIVVMVPLGNGKMYQWETTATELAFSHWNFEARDGETPELERFLQTAIDHAPPTEPAAR